MKFDPISKRIYTDNGELIKQMHCPYRMAWNDLIVVDELDSSRQCSVCDHGVIDTAKHNDKELLEMSQQDPNTCFKLSMDQDGLEIISERIHEEPST